MWWRINRVRERKENEGEGRWWWGDNLDESDRSNQSAIKRRKREESAKLLSHLINKTTGTFRHGCDLSQILPEEKMWRRGRGMEKLRLHKSERKWLRRGNKKKKEARKTRAIKNYNRSKIAKVRLKEQHLQLRITLWPFHLHPYRLLKP